jgi:hypothetical protein
MAITNHERVGKALELLKNGLDPFIECEMMSIYKERAATKTNRFMGEDRLNAKKPIAEWDVLLKLMWKSWNEVFRLPHRTESAQRTSGPPPQQVGAQEAFSSDDTYRALDSSGRHS